MQLTKRSIRVAVSVGVLGGATAVALQLATGSAAADEASVLPIASSADLVVDAAHQRIFISDPAGGQVLTTDYAGQVLATTGGLPGVRDLLLTDRLYAAVPSAGTIVAFDPATTAKVDTYDTGATPSTLAAAAGKIWFGEDGHGLGSLDLSGAQPVITRGSDLPDLGGAWWSSAPQLATSAARPDLVAAADTRTSNGEFSLIDVAADPATAVARRSVASRAAGLAFSPDGSRLVVTGVQGVVSALSSTDLTTIEDFQATDPFPDTVAVREDGAVAVAAGRDHVEAVALYTPGTAAAAKRLDLQQALDADGNPISLNLTALGPGLAWEPGGSRLFGVAVKQSTKASQPVPTLTLQVLNDVAPKPVSISVAAPATAQPGRAYTVIGFLSPPVPSGLPLVITRTDPSAPAGRRVGPETVPDGGSFEFEDVSSVAGTVTYTVSFAGNDEFAAATASASVTVAAARATSLTLDRNGSTSAFGASVTFTAKLGATQQNRVVEIWADPSGADQPNRLLRKAAVDAKGNLTASLKLTRTTVVSARYGGDAATTPKTVISTVATKASVATTVSRQFKTAKIGTTSYSYFHKTKHPLFTTKVNPFPGRKQYVQIDVYRGGKWVLSSSGYQALTAAGTSVKEVKGTHTTGIRYRLRSAYVSGKSGDTANATSYGPYRYFTFTK